MYSESSGKYLKTCLKFKDAILRIQPLKGPPFMSIQPLAKNLHEELLYKFYDSELDRVRNLKCLLPK